MFSYKPTGTTYRFDNMDLSITISTNHNFARDIDNIHFDDESFFGLALPQLSVKIYVTVTKTGEYGTATVDIIDW
jgi:hypothetical protein